MRLLVLFEILVAAAALIVLLIALCIAHRAGRLKRIRARHVLLAAAALTTALIAGQSAWMQYNLNNFPLEQPGTVWETADGSIYLSVDDSGGQTMYVLYEGGYRAARLDRYGQPYPTVDIYLDDAPYYTPVLVSSSKWYMSGSGRMVICGDGERIVLERADAGE